MRKALAVLLFCGGAALIAVSFLNFSEIAARYSPDGAVSAQFLRDVAVRSRACGVVVIGIAIALIVSKSQSLKVSKRLRSWQSIFETLRLCGFATLTLILIGAVARAWLLNAPLHWDEAFTFNEFVSRPPYDFLSRYSHPNNHVFHTVLAWVARTISDEKWVLRLPAFLAGVAILGAIYFLARKLRGENTALLATALAAGASPLVEYSAQGRGYTILTLATLLLFSIPRERWLLASVIAALGAWTIPIMLFPFAAYVASLLLQRTPVTHVVRVAIATGAMTFLLYLPILIVSGPRSITDNGNVQPLPLREFVSAFPRSMASMWEVWMIVPVIAAIAGIAKRGGPARLALATIAGIAPLLLILRVLPFARVWVFLLPLFLILVATGFVSERWPRPIIIALSIVIAIALSWNAIRATNRRDFFEDPAMRDVPVVAAFLRTTLPPDASLLAIQPLDAPLAFEFRDPRLVQQRFDSDPRAVRDSLRSRPHAWVMTPRGGTAEYERIRLVSRFPSSEVWEIR